MQLTGKSNWAKLPLLFLILSVTSGCATVSTVPVNSYCAIAKPITYDATQDTPETVAEVEAHNSRFICLCEQDCPATAPDTK
jgi:ABC-type Fe3+-hydroxamate transport system substrate-binding protein